MMQISNRKYYIDNLRSFTVLLLFPYHIFMVYNNWGESWYIHGENLAVPSFINMINSCWMMPLLFCIAGVSSRYSLQKRSAGEYAKERVNKLLLPFVFGMFLIVPVQPYLAGLYFYGKGNYLDFFTKFEDLSGYNGGWTVGHLWFILFLFVISMICLPFMLRYNSRGKGTIGGKWSLVFVMLLGLLPCITGIDIFEFMEPGGKSPLEYTVFFLLGFFFLSNDSLIDKLEKNRFLLSGLAVAAIGLVYYLGGIFREAASWILILMVIGLFKRYLNFRNKFTDYLAKSSFGVYIFHQSVIVAAAFFTLKITSVPALQMLLIFISAVPITYFIYELCARTPVLRWMFALNSKKELK